jgi:phage tail protein X
VKEVRIIAKSRSIDITVQMGDGAAVITGGLGGWKSVERLDDIAFSSWEGQEPLTQDVPILLDGWGRNPESVERQMNTIFKLGRDFSGPRSAPPVFTVWGPIFFEGKNWVLGDGGIELGTADTIREDDGTLVRQSLVLHLMEYVNPNQVKRNKHHDVKGAEEVTPEHQRGEPGKTGGTAFPGNTYTTQQGDTLVSIAAKLYGNWEAWKALGAKNGLKEANAKLPAGTHLILP